MAEKKSTIERNFSHYFVLSTALITHDIGRGALFYMNSFQVYFFQVYPFSAIGFFNLSFPKYQIRF